jgi:hypothetical protein
MKTIPPKKTVNLSNQQPHCSLAPPDIADCINTVLTSSISDWLPLASSSALSLSVDLSLPLLFIYVSSSQLTSDTYDVADMASSTISEHAAAVYAVTS